MSSFPITLTPAAHQRVSDVLHDEGERVLRIAVQGGGCAGFSYDFSFVQEAEPEDLVLNLEAGLKVVMDPFSAPLLEGSTLDYVDELLNKRLVIDNPRATTCGCGSSFSF